MKPMTTLAMLVLASSLFAFMPSAQASATCVGNDDLACVDPDAPSACVSMANGYACAGDGACAYQGDANACVSNNGNLVCYTAGSPSQCVTLEDLVPDVLGILGPYVQSVLDEAENAQETANGAIEWVYDSVPEQSRCVERAGAWACAYTGHNDLACVAVGAQVQCINWR
jgi:hypothetical protein